MKLGATLEQMKERKKAIEALLADDEDYTDQIEQLKQELRMLDEQLGVNKNE